MTRQANMYIADLDNQRVRMVNTAGVISTFASGVGIASGVAFDVFGNLYITDLSDYFVRKVNTAGSISIFAGIGTAGYSGHGGPATAAKLWQTGGVACDVAGNVYIGDYGNRIRMVNTSGIISTFAGNGTGGYSGDGGPATAAELGTPTKDYVLTPAGNLYIADQGNQRIRKVNTAGIVSNDSRKWNNRLCRRWRTSDCSGTAIPNGSKF